ncbi:MAG: hypothetical protein EBR82_11220 [Caulobacteraceae bacterium]|nr:hypothetical protein [Caulobacteraceae bacterium]
MTKRIAIDQLLAGSGVLRTEKAYTTDAASRFAVVQPLNAPGVWILVHRRSGIRIQSLLPSAKLSLAAALRYIAALDALEIDWTPFDTIDEVRWSGAPPKGFKTNPSQETVDAMRAAIRGAQ